MAKKLFAIFLAAAFSFAVLSFAQAESSVSDTLYNRAIRDAVFAEPSEIYPLVTLTRADEKTEWNARGDRVLMLTWHNMPELFSSGDTFASDAVEIWMVSARELTLWYQANKADLKDRTLRFEQMLGSPAGCGYTHMTALYVAPSAVIRPAYQPDPTVQVSPDDLDGSALGERKAWFDGNIIWSYFDSAWPWTRLGYTYDWADNGEVYGFSEFLLLPGAEAQIAWTMTNEEFFAYLDGLS